MFLNFSKLAKPRENQIQNRAVSSFSNKPSMDSSTKGKGKVIGNDEEESEETVRVPRPKWYVALMNESFHGKCRIHQNNRRNFFCFICRTAFCHDCVDPHYPHPRIQGIEDGMVGLEEISKLMDCSDIQTRFSAYDEKKIPLKPKHTEMSIKECKKFISKAFMFCSLSCKVEHELEKVGDLHRICVLEDSSESSSEDDQTVSGSGMDILMNRKQK
ncbi:PREDICTED: uncharacterized protein LOC104811754 [Tarenaya hassleriana]|uniref:uncharacterized protein LOC104811754 n=1 Tax=Tarenaya hassleriana TaxID=28532 RepID=UPI00053C3C08|nr:PREDICTED: uncharacterized protein LOC104811754 [Tarenaya hassleriana]